MQLKSPFPRQESFASGISPQCYKLIEIMTAKSAQERQSSWDYVIADIDLVLGGKSPVGRVMNERGEIGKVAASSPDAPIKLNLSRPVAPHVTAAAVRDVKPEVTETREPAEVVRTEAEVFEVAPDPSIRRAAPNAIPPRIQFKKKQKSLWWLYAIILLLIGAGGAAAWLILSNK